MEKSPRLVKAMLISFLLFVFSFSTIFISYNFGPKRTVEGTGSAILIFGLLDVLVIYVSFITSLVISMVNMGIWLKRGGPYFWLSVMVFFVMVGALAFVLHH